MKLKKWVALLLCGLMMTLGFTGCVGHLYDVVGTVDGTEISAGLYQMILYTAYGEARNKVEDTEKDVLGQKVDGENAKTWIQNRAEELARKYVAIQRLCRENNISFSEESSQNVQQTLQYWAYLEELYTKNGIAYETLERYLNNEQLGNQLFNTLYGEGGARAPQDDELKSQYGEKNAHIRFVAIPLSSQEEDAPDVSDEVIAGADALAEKLQGSGKTLDSVLLTDVVPLFEITDRDYDPVSATDQMSDMYVEYDQEENEYYTAEFLAELKTMQVGDYGTYNMGANYLIFQKIETFESEEAFTEMRASVVEKLCRPDFDDYLRSVYDQYPVEWRFGARWFYRPSKLTR